jgi:hypothetical protein
MKASRNEAQYVRFAASRQSPLSRTESAPIDRCRSLVCLIAGCLGSAYRADPLIYGVRGAFRSARLISWVMTRLETSKLSIYKVRYALRSCLILLAYVMISSESRAEVKTAPLVATVYSLADNDKSDLMEIIWRQELPEIRRSQQTLMNSVKLLKLKYAMGLFTATLKYEGITYFMSAFNFNCQTSELMPDQRQCLAKIAKIKDGKVLSVISIPDFIIVAKRGDRGFNGYDPDLYTRFRLDLPSSKLSYEIIEKNKPDERIPIDK